MKRELLSALALTSLVPPGLPAQTGIVYDGEFELLRQQHGERWDAEDKEIDKTLADIRAKNRGRRPNILYILIDDLSFGQMGSRKLNYVVGFDTPSINEFSGQSLNLMRMYTEPSCTPTRAALLTGRHPVRTGIKEVKVALVGEGLGADEVTTAEVLSEAGYATSHVGKWHQGDIEEAYPHNQGFDYAAFPLHQQVQLSLMTDEAADSFRLIGIADNTMVVLMADNGCMHLIPAYTSGFNELIYRGGKTDFTEGGVRVDAFVRWPAGIEGGTFAGDIVHVSDLFTTFARVDGATAHIPTDRVIDGVDQTALFLKGEKHGRRDYVYIYQNELLRAVVKQEFKMHIPAPGMPAAGADVFNLFRDPREEQPYVGLALWSGASFQDMIKRHMVTIARYPHNELGKGRPLRRHR